MARRAASPPLVFVDTNVFLDLYAVQEELPPATVQRLEDHGEHLIGSFQVQNEFERNRMKLLQRLLSSTEAPSPGRVPALFSDKRTRSTIQRQYDTIGRGHERIAQRIEKAFERSDADPVYRLAKRTWQASGHYLEQDDVLTAAVMEHARGRLERGDPPRKFGDMALGDAINWEWCLHVCHEEDRDLLVVSRDRDFGAWHREDAFLNTFLAGEFERRVGTGRRAQLTTLVTDALKHLGATVSQDEMDAERRMRQAMRDRGDDRGRDGDRRGSGRGR